MRLGVRVPQRAPPDLVRAGVFATASVASEVLAGKRSLTTEQVRTLQPSSGCQPTFSCTRPLLRNLPRITLGAAVSAEYETQRMAKSDEEGRLPRVRPALLR